MCHFLEKVLKRNHNISFREIKSVYVTTVLLRQFCTVSVLGLDRFQPSKPSQIWIFLMEKLILSVNCYTFPFEFIPRLLFFHDCVLYNISMNKPLMVQLYLSSRTIFLYFLSRCWCTKISFNLRRIKDPKSEPKILFYEKYLLSVILILICTCSFLVFQL